MKYKFFLIISFVILQNYLYGQKKKELENQNIILNERVKELENKIIEYKAQLLADRKTILNQEVGIKDLVSENRDFRVQIESLKIKIENLEKENSKSLGLVKSIQSELERASYKAPMTLI